MLDLEAIFGEGPTSTMPVETPTPEVVTMQTPMPADGWPAGSVPPGEPCPNCGGLLWGEDLEGGRHCLDCEGAKFKRAEELAGLAQRLRAAGGLPPWGTKRRSPSGGSWGTTVRPVRGSEGCRGHYSQRPDRAAGLRPVRAVCGV
jgi:hypothetical protein